MSFRSVSKRGVAAAVIPVVTGLALAGGGAALASTRSPGLHQTARIALGSTSSIFKNVFTQAPNGVVFFSKGTVVYAVVRNSAPAVAVHAGGQVMALAANSADLFVQVGLKVTAYRRTDGLPVRTWTLTSPVTPITLAGLIAVGNTLWSYTDWGTDSSGFEFGRVSRISTTSATVHVVDKQAYPADWAANSSGLYFQDARGADNKGFLVHVTPAGVVHAKRGPVDWPMALAGGKLYELSFHSSGPQFIDGFSTSTLARVSSAQVSSADRNIAGANLGLLVLALPCSQLTCASSTVSKLSAGGAATGTLSVPHAFYLLSGPGGAVVEFTAGHMFLVRFGT
jgi:hypothetical protein